MGKNAGIIGFGGMGNHHFNNIAQIEEMNVTAVYDINPDKVKLAEEKGVKGYYSLDGILSDKSLEVIIIATPNNFHKELSIAALRAGQKCNL